MMTVDQFRAGARVAYTHATVTTCSTKPDHGTLLALDFSCGEPMAKVFWDIEGAELTACLENLTLLEELMSDAKMIEHLTNSGYIIIKVF